MSYGQSPPRTPYGDQDFIKEEWNDQQPPPPLQRMPPTMAGRPLVPPHQQPSYADQYQNPPGQAAYSSAAQPIQSQALVLEQIKSTKLTPEDQIFISGWRRDSFFYRGEYISNQKNMRASICHLCLTNQIFCEIISKHDSLTDGGCRQRYILPLQ